MTVTVKNEEIGTDYIRATILFAGHISNYEYKDTKQL